MKTQKCISIFSLTVTGLLIGTPQAMASPLLDSDLASFTVLGGSSERYFPKISGDGSGGRSGGVKAVAASNASAASAGSANPMTGSQQGMGSADMQLARTLYSPGIANPGREVPARPSSIDELASVIGEPPLSPPDDNRDIVRSYFCAMAQANLPIAAFDPDLCNDISPPKGFQNVAATPGIAMNPSLKQSPHSSNRPDSDRDTGELTKDLQRALLLAKLPVDLGPNSDSADDVPPGLPIQSSAPDFAPAFAPAFAPDIAPAFAAFPSALVIDELAATVPEPATLMLLALGLAGIGYNRKRTA